jgi:hypothetical protein
MRKLILMLGVAGIALLVQVVTIQPSAAYIAYPWCAYSGGRDGAGPSCGSSTFEQCLATVSGTGGYCARNRYYEEPAPQPAPKRRHQRPRG